MGIVNDNAKELLGVARAAAVSHLGGEVGNDYAPWADDIAQDTLLKLSEREADGKLENAFVAFSLAKVIARFDSINLQTKERRRREIEEEHGESINRTLTGQSAESLAADPYEELPREEAVNRLGDLSPLLRRIVIAHYINGISVAEIARYDNLTEDVVYKRLQRARDIVKGDNNNE